MPFSKLGLSKHLLQQITATGFKKPYPIQENVIPKILAGKDLLAGGTWIAFGKNQQFAAITNYRDPKSNNSIAPSRGAIPVNLIEENPNDFQQYVKDNKVYWSEMNGFNLLYHNGKETY